MNWKEVRVPWSKKWRNKTILQILYADYRYVRDFLTKCDDDLVREAALAAVEHKRTVDPYSGEWK